MLDVRRPFRRPAHRTRSDGHMGTNLDAILDQLRGAFRVHHKEDDIGCFAADLESNAPRAEGEHGRRIPWTVSALSANQHTASIGAANNKCDLQLRWNDADTHGFI